MWRRCVQAQAAQALDVLRAKISMLLECLQGSPQSLVFGDPTLTRHTVRVLRWVGQGVVSTGRKKCKRTKDKEASNENFK